MATADKVIITPPMQAEYGYTLTLTKQEAEDLRLITYTMGGDPEETLRSTFASIGAALHYVGINPADRGRFLDKQGGSVSINGRRVAGP